VSGETVASGKEKKGVSEEAGRISTRCASSTLDEKSGTEKSRKGRAPCLSGLRASFAVWKKNLVKGERKR